MLVRQSGPSDQWNLLDVTTNVIVQVISEYNAGVYRSLNKASIFVNSEGSDMISLCADGTNLSGVTENPPGIETPGQYNFQFNGKDCHSSCNGCLEPFRADKCLACKDASKL